jgi:hypothetical protein
MAVALPPLANEDWPNAEAPSAVALLDTPTAVDAFMLATELAPTAVACSPADCANTPIAVLPSPVA